jgi:ATP-dependent Clp protease ATP-binding subunit ClpA
VRNEHLVLGLLSEPDGLAAKAIVALGVSPDDVRRAMESAMGPAKKRGRLGVPFSGGSKKTLELALRAALHLMHNYIGTEHLLLGILDNEGENAAKLLRELGITRAAAADWLIAELAAIQAARGA